MALTAIVFGLLLAAGIAYHYYSSDSDPPETTQSDTLYQAPEWIHPEAVEPHEEWTNDYGQRAWQGNSIPDLPPIPTTAAAFHAPETTTSPTTTDIVTTATEAVTTTIGSTVSRTSAATQSINSFQPGPKKKGKEFFKYTYDGEAAVKKIPTLVEQLDNLWRIHRQKSKEYNKYSFKGLLEPDGNGALPELDFEVDNSVILPRLKEIAAVPRDNELETNMVDTDAAPVQMNKAEYHGACAGRAAFLSACVAFVWVFQG